MKKIFSVAALVTALLVTSCNNSSTPATETTGDKKPDIKEEQVSYKLDTLNMKGYVSFEKNKQGKRPGILVVHEWWGLTDYTRTRAKQLAELGYIAMAVDMYGDGKTGDTPPEALALASTYYQNPQLAKTRLDAALAKLKSYPETDTANIAAIGYCFGGFIVLNAAKLGADLKGVVSFHGDLSGVQPSKDLLKAKILICQGEDDNFVPQTAVDAFKKSMDSIGVNFTYKSYPNATHAFTNPKSTETGKKFNMPIKYNAAADSASWNDMKTFFGTIFTTANP